jgi:polyphenol oxidase
MISPPGWGGIAFSEGADGDLRSAAPRVRFSAANGIESRWAEVNQVHGAKVIEAHSPGVAGEADALWTASAGLPVAIFTADCFGVVLQAEGAVGVAHAGWRGAAAGVVAKLGEEMARAGHQPVRAAIGPGIGPCCFEVGPEVSEKFPDEQESTTWGTASVDLAARLRADLPESVEVWSAGGCTRHQERWFSHRRTGSKDRMVSVGWI